MLSKYQFAFLLFAGFPLMSTCATADSGPSAPNAPLSATPRTVEQMLAIDAQRALMNEQRLLLEEQRKGGYGRLTEATDNHTAPADAKPKEASKPSVPPVQIELLGIFGLGSVLQADVEINGNRYRYKKGFELPVGAGDDFRFLLVGLNKHCIALSEKNGPIRKVCLSRTSL